jgi:hypothetical protein
MKPPTGKTTSVRYRHTHSGQQNGLPYAILTRETPTAPNHETRLNGFVTTIKTNFGLNLE